MEVLSWKRNVWRSARHLPMHEIILQTLENEMVLARNWLCLFKAFTVTILAASSFAIGATTLPGIDAIEDFVRTRERVLEIDGKATEDAEIYYSRYQVAWLVRAPVVGALLISPRGQSIQRVAESHLRRSDDATAVLEQGAIVESLTIYESDRDVIRFTLDDQRYALAPAPPMLGRQTLASVEDRHPGFGEKAARFWSKSGFIAAPAKATSNDVTVRVYFASWSRICQRILPKILGVERQWSNVRFEYYGLPKPLVDDPHAVEQRISGVPTILVLRAGEEIQRLTGRQLDDPAAALRQALGGP